MIVRSSVCVGSCDGNGKGSPRGRVWKGAANWTLYLGDFQRVAVPVSSFLAQALNFHCVRVDSALLFFSSFWMQNQ